MMWNIPVTIIAHYDVIKVYHDKPNDNNVVVVVANGCRDVEHSPNEINTHFSATRTYGVLET